MTATALTGTLFNLGPIDFLGLGSASKSGWAKSNDPHSKMITLYEIMQGSQHGSAIDISVAIKRNIKANGMMGVAVIVGAQVVNAVAKKTGVYRTLNKTIRSAGLGKLVKF
jgi:hypothetical protein